MGYTLKDLASRTMINGVLKHGSILIAVSMLYYVVPENAYIEIVVVGLSGGYLISVVENLGALGAPIPKGMLDKLRNFDNISYGKDEEDEI